MPCQLKNKHKNSETLSMCNQIPNENTDNSTK